MAISIDYTTYVINVDKNETTFIGTNPQTGLEIRQLNVETFGKKLADIQDDQSDVWAPTAFEYTAPKDVGGIQLAPVLLILSPYTVTFEDGQYAVNLIGGNTNLQDFTNVNQVSIRPSNSVGSTYSDAINSQSFLKGEVVLDTNDGVSGTSFPIGTPPLPSNNLTDTLAILTREGLHAISLTGVITANGTHNLNGISIIAGNGAGNVLTLSGASTLYSSFDRLIIIGAFNGLSRVVDCILGTTGLGGVTGVQGRIKNSIINNAAGIIQQAGGAGTLFDNCSFLAPNNPQITLNTNGEGFGLRNCTGNILITNYTKAEIQQLHTIGATIEIDSSCTAGTLIFTGSAEITDNSGAGCTVIDLTDKVLTGSRVWSEEIVGDINPNSAARQLELAKTYSQIASTNI